MQMKRRHELYLVVALATIFGACGLPRADVLREGESIFIQDRTGKKWDVTTAVDEYGFEAEAFQYGLGPNAIRPLLEPRMLAPGDPGYPTDGDETVVLGTMINGESRAYPIAVLSRFEVANEAFGDTHVAVAY
jgi:hypothetical protein